MSPKEIRELIHDLAKYAEQDPNNDGMLIGLDGRSLYLQDLVRLANGYEWYEEAIREARFLIRLLFQISMHVPPENPASNELLRTTTRAEAWLSKHEGKRDEK